MAAYAVTVTLDRRNRAMLLDGLGILTGKCDVTNYNTALAEINAITKQFRTILQVICDGISDNGFVFKWDRTGKAFRCYEQGFTTGSTAVAVMENGALVEDEAAAETAFRAAGVAIDTTIKIGKLQELPVDIDVGEVGFIAIGVV